MHYAVGLSAALFRNHIAFRCYVMSVEVRLRVSLTEIYSSLLQGSKVDIQLKHQIK